MKHPFISKTRKVSIEVITPTVAAWLLENANTKNRNINKPHVSQLVKKIINNQFDFSNDFIWFDTEGILGNGQHRLKACVLADKSIEVGVITGISDRMSMIEKTDVGKGRSMSDLIHLMVENVEATNLIVAIGRNLYAFEHRFLNENNKTQWLKANITRTQPREVAKTIEDNYDNIYPVFEIAKKSSKSKYKKVGFLVAVVEYAKKYPEKAHQFLREVIDGIADDKESWGEGYPPRTLREYLNDDNAGGEAQIQVLCGKTFSAIKAFHEERKLSILQQPNELKIK